MGAEGHRVPQPTANIPGCSHEQLKNWTDTGQPGDAESLGESWKEMANGLQEAAESLMIAVFGSEEGWKGQAANAMREQLRKVAEWSRKTGDGFDKASEAFVQQGEAVGTAKTAMPDPVEFNPQKMIKEAAAGGIVDMAMLPYTMYKQHQAQQQAHEQAIQVVAQRDAALAAAAASIPPFEPPPQVGGGGSKEPPPGNPGMPGTPGIRPGMPGTGSRGGVPGQGGPNNGPNGGGGFVPGFNGGQGFGPNDPNNPNNPNGDDNNSTPPNVNIPSMPIGTGTSGYSPSPTTGFGPNGPQPSPFSAGPTAAGGGGGFGGAFGGGFGPGGAPRPGGGFGPLGSAAGAAAGAGAGAGTPPPGAGGMGGGGRGGAAGGRGGMGGMGGMGGGRGEGGDDEEHQRPSYLVEPDPDATFGTDQLTAPPVIGG